MKKPSFTAIRMIVVIWSLFVLLLAAGLLVTLFVFSFESPLKYTLGLLIGCVLSTVKVLMMERAIARSFDMEEDKAKTYATAQSMLRYGVTIVVLAAALFLNAYFGLFGIILGVLTLQFSAYIVNGLIQKGKKNKRRLKSNTTRGRKMRGEDIWA